MRDRRNRLWRLLGAAAALLLLFSACGQQRFLPGSREAGRSVEQRPIECLTLGSGPDVSFILAAIHGDEPAGVPLVQDLARYLRKKPDLLTSRTVVLVPVANPDGFAKSKRNNAHGVDVNRNFPTANRQSLARSGESGFSEPESQVLARLFEQYRPARILSLHQPMKAIDYDGPARELAECMEQYCELPVRRIGSRPGSLGTYAGVERNIPIITLEMPHETYHLTRRQLWEHYGRLMVGFVLYPETAAEAAYPHGLLDYAYWAAAAVVAAALAAWIVLRRRRRAHKSPRPVTEQ